MNKTVFRLGIVTSLLAILDFLLRNISVKKIGFLTKPILTINLLEIIILIVCIFLLYNILPKIYKAKKERKRSKEFLENWKLFKKVLCKYIENHDEGLQVDYEELREKLCADFNRFSATIYYIQTNSHRNFNEETINNFEGLFSPRNISEWPRVVQRKIPEELDCFDYLVLSLFEHYN